MYYKIFIPVLILTISLGGCGGSAGGTESGTQKTKSVTHNYNNGSVALWDYLVPAGDTTNSYIKTNGTTTQKYRTRFVREADTVTEVSDLSKNEKTIYKKNKENITILFYTDGTENGRLELKPTVDIGDIVTIKKSDCKLEKVWDTFTFEKREFKDVIEIRCGETPGYYQRGRGEILQERHLAESGKVETKMITER